MKSKHYTSLRVNPEVHRRIKALAACEGMQINKYLDDITSKNEIIIKNIDDKITIKKNDKKKFIFKL